MVMATSARITPHSNYIGSAAEAVVRNSQFAALLVGPRCRWNDRLVIERVVVPVDGSELSEQALPLAMNWAHQLNVPAWVVTVIDRDTRSFAELSPAQVAPVESNYVHNVANQFPGRAQTCWEVLHGKPSEALIEYTDATTLTVMSTHGRSGLARVIVGSVTSKLLRNAQGPVLVQRVQPGRGKVEQR